MAPISRQAIGLVAALCAAYAAADDKVLHKDVVIVGGGATGAHAAFRLREDMNKSIALVEKQAILGGHVNSYVAPESGNPHDYGVLSYIDVHNASAFVERLGIPVATPGHVNTTTRYVDFTRGQPVNFTAPAFEEQFAALAIYGDICAKYEHMILPSFWDFPAPEDIPEDLLMLFGDFVKKYDIEAVVPLLFPVTGLGVGDVTKQLTMTVMQAFGGPMVRSFLGEQASFVPASGRNQDIYDTIGKRLGDDVLYSSTVVETERSDEGVTVTVQSKAGETTVIHARRLLLAIEPTAANLEPFDLDDQEIDVFSKFDYTSLYAAIVTHPSLPVGVSLTNLPSAAAPNNYLTLPDVNFTGSFEWWAEEDKDLFRVLVVGDRNLGSCAAQSLMQRDFDTLVKGGVVPAANSTALEWRGFSTHGAMHMHASAEDLRAGFIQDLYALQGLRSTWWTGGAWVAQFQTHLWWYNDILLPMMLEGM